MDAQANNDLPLASDFPAATRAAWEAAVERVLKGASFDKKLVGRSYDGLRIEPLYGKSEAPVSFPGRAPAPWRVSQRVEHPDPAEANALALADLDGGSDALTLVFAGAPSARGFGLDPASQESFDRALEGVMLDLIEVRLEAGLRGREAMARVRDLAGRRGHGLADLHIEMGLDPIGALAATGHLSAPWEVVGGRLAENLAVLDRDGFAGRIAVADGRPYHEAGGGEAQELAAVLATGVAYLRALETGGHALDRARRALSFTLAADADEFLTVAKFRALRRLWARVEEACGLEPEPIRLHAETAWRMTTRRDPWVNLLRDTMAVFSAGIGGADSVTVLPMTTALGLPDAFSRRLARNTQLILLEEANLWRVADPVAGSGGFEALTEELAEAAWRAFQAIERDGGIVQSLGAGNLQAQISETRAKRERAVATRRDPVTGTSEFPDIREAPVAVLAPMPAGQGVAEPAAASGLSCEPLPSIRLAGPYEDLRDRSDAILAETGARPRVFLANLGPIAAFSARATFAKNAFEAGGIEAVTNDGFGSLDDLVQAFRTSGTRLACLCSSDAIYETQAVDAAGALKAAGAETLFLAGRPADMDELLKKAGVRFHVYVGCDLIDLLRAAMEGAR